MDVSSEGPSSRVMGVTAVNIRVCMTKYINFMLMVC